MRWWAQTYTTLSRVDVEFQLVRAEVEDEVGGQRRALILDGQHFDPLSRLDSEGQRQQVADEEFEVSAGRLLVLVGGHVVEGAEGPRQGVEKPFALIGGEPIP